MIFQKKQGPLKWSIYSSGKDRSSGVLKQFKFAQVVMLVLTSLETNFGWISLKL